MEITNYYGETSEQLWKRLKDVDRILRAVNGSSPDMVKMIEDLAECKFALIKQHYESKRMRIINAFVLDHGYNPDNLLTTKSTI